MLYTWAGPEIAVATTKAYSTQMAVLNLLGLYFGEVMGTVDYETYTAMIRDILDLPEKLEQVLAQADRIREMAKDFAGRDDVFFIGRNLDYALSLEGSLKLKEISYIHSEALPPRAEARHHLPDRGGNAGYRPEHLRASV